MILATIQLLDNLKTPAKTPKIVAKKQPTTATSNVFKTPTTEALQCVDWLLYSIRR